ncbi:hypothetical protein PoB_001218800, partial [Plakobranchus ocellatus]
TVLQYSNGKAVDDVISHLAQRLFDKVVSEVPESLYFWFCGISVAWPSCYDVVLDLFKGLITF